MRIYMLGFGVFAAAGIITASVGFMTDMSPPLKMEKIRMAEASQPAFALVYLAESMGYFAEEGVEIEYDTYTSGRNVLARVIAGRNDIGTVFEAPIVVETFDGNKLSVVSELHSSSRNAGLVVRKDRGIFSVQDLKGKRIAVPINTNAEYFLKLFLTNEGIEQNEITFVPSKPLEAVDALMANDIDAVAVWNPNLYDVQTALNSNRVVTFYSDVYTEVSVLALKREVADKQGVAIKRILKALVRAENYLAENQEDEEKRFPEKLQMTTWQVWDSVSPEIKLGSLLLNLLQGQANWYKKSEKFDKPVPNFKETIDARFLKKVSPASAIIE